MPAVRISNVLTFRKEENPSLDPRRIRKHFSYPNPKFLENIRLGHSNFATPRTINITSLTRDRLTLPRGTIATLKKLLPDLRIEDETLTNAVDFAPSGIHLKPFQKPAVEKLLKRNQGVLVAPPGSGKTIMAIELIVRRGQKTLILVHTKDLSAQWLTRISEWAGIKPGVIDASTFDVGEVTVGMIQTLSRPLERPFVEQFGCVVLDEAHHVPAETFQTLLNQFPARYRYGLTATPIRRDGLDFLLTGTLGPILYTIEKADLIESGNLMRPKVRAVHTDLYLEDCKDYGTLIEAATESSGRNDLILRHLALEAVDHLCLVLSERVRHVRLLHELFTERHPDIPAGFITGEVKGEERVTALDSLRRGEIRVLFATRIADEGLDVLALDRLFLTCPIRFAGKVEQQVGRILRVCEGKQQPVVYDFVDSLVGLATSQWGTRKSRVYADVEIEEVKFEETAERGLGGPCHNERQAFSL